VQNPPADWAGVRDRWQVAHLIRTCAALLAFGVLIGSAVRGQRSTPAAVSRSTMRSWETA
jgi:hypothetical protein